jgi:hypothetical protein
MKTINLNLAEFKNLSGQLAKNLRGVFFAVFLLMLVLEVLQIKNSVFIVSNVNQAPVASGSEPGVRINFDNYNKAVARIQQAATFQPTGGITNNPFNPSQSSPKPVPSASSTPVQSGQ